MCKKELFISRARMSYSCAKMRYVFPFYFSPSAKPGACSCLGEKVTEEAAVDHNTLSME